MSATESLIERLKAAAKPVKDLAGVGPRGPVYRTTKPARGKLLTEAAAELEALSSRCERMERTRDEAVRELESVEMWLDRVATGQTAFAREAIARATSALQEGKP